jgi:hypothetical protein
MSGLVPRRAVRQSSFGRRQRAANPPDWRDDWVVTGGAVERPADNVQPAQSGGFQRPSARKPGGPTHATFNRKIDAILAIYGRKVALANGD